MPVKTMAMPASSAAAITSASRIEPPGWITAVTPASAATIRPSAKGKKASEATTEPFASDSGRPAVRAASSAFRAAIKAEHAGLPVPGAVMASDAFFPFRDGIDNAAKAGITAVIQPGGSMRDAEVIAAADEAGMAMVFTGMRHFRH